MSFTSERVTKAVRKVHICGGCGRRIEVGQPANRWSGMTEGQFGTAIYHPDCRKAEVDLNNDILGFQYGDDWCALSDLDDEDWPWLIDAYPQVAARLGIKAAAPPPTSISMPVGKD